MRARPFAASLLVLALCAPSAAAQILYVDASATGANDGSSWANAFTELRNALPAATTGPYGTSVWIAEGVYHPGTPGSVVNPFVITSGVRVYGGFAGFETSLAQRDVAAHPTILSGDLLDDDLPAFGNVADNSWVVVWIGDANADTVLDGVVVEGGNSISSIYWMGGGIHAIDVSPLIQGCVVRRNRNAVSGGGAVSEAPRARFVDCVFEDNFAQRDGGGLALVGSVDWTNGSRIERCTFRRNHAQVGYGGGAYVGPCRVIDCVFTGNSALYGGGLGNEFQSGEVSGCTVVGNAAFNGGGMRIWTMAVSNCVVWDNVGGQIFQSGPIASSTVQGSPGFDGLDPRFADADGPDDVFGTSDDDLRLLPGSPCIDAGNNALVAPGVQVDVAGLPRFMDDPDTIDTGFGGPPTVDRGAHEYAPCPPPTSFCVTSPNTVGPGAQIGSTGTAKIYANELLLRVVGCPPSTFGLFLHGPQTDQTPFGNGFRCVGGSVEPVGIVPVDAAGVAQLAFNATASPSVAPGVQRHFQFWYRNPAAGGAGFNLSDGMTVQFCP